ncbi:hypothetical protein HMPREF3033_00048 [Veillonellaceae bacterium DNF00751]|uniref:Uncharacterized protein n=1 Tax=Megasphaera lornae TaxID=1000568 RepID=D3LVL4_9FIRM|nr:hypothetical protein HMPREF0889_1017 [Megasphaera genomosp. type_1 str. 28L]KXB94177.1 hypothetical protein HMPREF3033_00048 [Veillonellaceae bacterium DNF00751]
MTYRQRYRQTVGDRMNDSLLENIDKIINILNSVILTYSVYFL